MKHLFKLLIAAASLACSVIFAHAGTSGNGEYLAVETISCADYIQRYSAETAARNTVGNPQRGTLYTPLYIAAHYYVAGYLTAINRATAYTFNILPGGLDGGMLWLENFC
jgi:hypothetical protein